MFGLAHRFKVPEKMAMLSVLLDYTVNGMHFSSSSI